MIVFLILIIVQFGKILMEVRLQQEKNRCSNLSKCVLERMSVVELLSRLDDWIVEGRQSRMLWTL